MCAFPAWLLLNLKVWKLGRKTWYFLLQELPDDETVCQFCGVSYLIHHEIKKLEDKIVELEGKLEKANSYKEREIKLHDEIKKGKDGLNVLNGLLSEKDNLWVLFGFNSFKITDWTMLAVGALLHFMKIYKQNVPFNSVYYIVANYNKQIFIFFFI